MISEEERINLLSKCKDIDCICQDCMYLQFVKNNILSELQQENQSLKDRIEKAVDTLYCWGEVLDPEFQDKMLNILLKGDK